MANPIPAQKAPYAAEVEAGRKNFWCACGHSRKQPFCNGSHTDTGLSPVPNEPSESGTAWFCGCKATGNRPLCDGTHKTL